MLNSERAQISLRQRHRQEKLERILSAGRTLFARDGFDATTTRDLAREAGIGVGTLFLYFPEKRDVLLRLFKEDIEPVHRAAMGALDPDLPLLEAAVRVFRRLYDHYARDLRLSRVFLSELAFLDPERRADLMSFTRDFVRALADLVERERVRGLLRADAEPLSTARTLFRLYYAVLIEWVGGGMPSPAAAERELRSSLSHLMRGLATAGGSPT